MNLRPSTALGSVTERAMTMTSISASAGMPILLKRSMPPETPPITITMQMTMNSSVKKKHPKGLASIASKVATPVICCLKRSLRPKLSSARFRDMY